MVIPLVANLTVSPGKAATRSTQISLVCCGGSNATTSQRFGVFTLYAVKSINTLSPLLIVGSMEPELTLRLSQPEQNTITVTLRIEKGSVLTIDNHLDSAVRCDT